MLFYCDTITSRLRYITAFIGNEIGSAFEFAKTIEEFKNYAGPKINYSGSRIIGDEVWIVPHGLLFEKNIRDIEIDCFTWNGRKTFFRTNGDWPFDIFAASFYLLSRYEEYLPHKKDEYGRYAHTNSIAFKEGFLQEPLVNSWIINLKAILREKFPTFKPQPSTFNFLPTYDIDMAWEYKHKGWWRNTGGLLLSLIKGQFAKLGERMNVLSGKRKDPYDTYDWLDQLHDKYKLQPHYFFLVPVEQGRYDKNISPHKKEMQQLVRKHASRYRTGIHPSWHSGDKPQLLKKEIETLTTIAGTTINSSRQHYIRFILPETFRSLIDNGIRFDFSMGYGSINGFRASVASPFFWYDLENDSQTPLLLYPFCYMEANSFYEQHHTAEQSLDEIRHYYKVVKAVGGTMIMIWHNSFLGTSASFKGWREVYEVFMQEV